MEVIDIFKEILKFKSITPNDDGALNFITMYLGEFELQSIEKEGVKNIFLSKKFGDGVHLCFAGHVDVVPPGLNWENPPFEPVESGGRITARGTQDMKSALAAMICALKDVRNFNGILSLLITSDEEGEAKYGTKLMLDNLSKQNSLPDFAIVGEPTCENFMGDTIKIARRGSINGILRIKGVQGHVAYPQKCVNPVHQLASKFCDFAGKNLDNGNEFFEPSKIVITDIRGGMEVCNVTPCDVKVMFNVRNSDLTSENDVRKYIENLFKDFEILLELKTSSLPFCTDKNSKIIENLSKSVEKICQIKPKLSSSGGTSDARFFAQFGVKVAEFGVKNDQIHAVNESVSVDEVIRLYSVYRDLIENFGGKFDA